MITPDQQREIAEGLTREGKLIEGGFAGFVLACEIYNAPPEQLQEMRMAFFGGAQHLLSSIMSIMDPGDDEPTDADMSRMALIQGELDTFIAEFEATYCTTAGGA